MTPKPDWEEPRTTGPSLSVAVRRAPKDFAYSFAQARQLVEAGKLVDARELMDGWRARLARQRGRPARCRRPARQAGAAGSRPSAPTAGRAPATRPWRRPSWARDRAVEARQGRPSLVAFNAAGRLDPADAAAAGFRAYALLQEDRVPEAVTAGQTAVGLDPRYADAFLPWASPCSPPATRRTASRRCGAGWCCSRSRTGRSA